LGLLTQIRSKQYEEMELYVSKIYLQSMAHF